MLPVREVSALRRAARAGDATRVGEVLAAEGVDVDEADEDGRTALMEASTRDLTPVIRLLIEAGAEVN